MAWFDRPRSRAIKYFKYKRLRQVCQSLKPAFLTRRSFPDAAVSRRANDPVPKTLSLSCRGQCVATPGEGHHFLLHRQPDFNTPRRDLVVASGARVFKLCAQAPDDNEHFAVCPGLPERLARLSALCRLVEISRRPQFTNV